MPKDTPRTRSADEIPSTYVPARNTIFLAFALGWAEVLGASDIFLGVNALDYSGYPDCRPEFIQAFQTMANLATRAGVEGGRRLTIHTPLIALPSGRSSSGAWRWGWTMASPGPATIPRRMEPPAGGATPACCA